MPLKAQNVLLASLTISIQLYLLKQLVIKLIICAQLKTLILSLSIDQCACLISQLKLSLRITRVGSVTRLAAYASGATLAMFRPLKQRGHLVILCHGDTSVFKTWLLQTCALASCLWFPAVSCSSIRAQQTLVCPFSLLFARSCA